MVAARVEGFRCGVGVEAARRRSGLSRRSKTGRVGEETDRTWARAWEMTVSVCVRSQEVRQKS